MPGTKLAGGGDISRGGGRVATMKVGDKQPGRKVAALNNGLCLYERPDKTIYMEVEPDGSEPYDNKKLLSEITNYG